MNIAINMLRRKTPNRALLLAVRLFLVVLITTLTACGSGGSEDDVSNANFTTADLVGNWTTASSATGPLWYQSQIGEANITNDKSYVLNATQYNDAESPTAVNSTGVASISENGFVSAIQNPQTNIELGWMDAGKTLMSHVFTATDMSSPQILAWFKRGSNYTNADWVGTWQLYALSQSPASETWHRTTIDINGDGSGSYRQVTYNVANAWTFDLADWHAVFPIDNAGNMDEVDEPERYTMDAGRTLILDTSSTKTFEIGVKVGQDYSLADLDGSWRSATIETGSATTNAYWVRGTFTVINGGAFNFSYTESDNSQGNSSGQFSISAQGEVTIENATDDQTCHLDAGKTVMVCTHAHNSGAVGLSIITKSE